MIEIRFLGRGGQGVVVGSELLGEACFREGFYPQCFSVFGGERRGAPVSAFVRIDKKKIHLKCDIDKPNQLVIFDPALYIEAEVVEQVKTGGIVLINHHGILKSETLANHTLGVIHALDISRKNGLGAIVNTVILGAYVGLTRIVNLSTLLEVIKDRVPSAVEQNIMAAKEGFMSVAVL